MLEIAAGKRASYLRKYFFNLSQTSNAHPSFGHNSISENLLSRCESTSICCDFDFSRDGLSDEAV